MIVALAGGTGASKLLRGMVDVYPQNELTIVVNTGDDIEIHGLRISPDVDIVTYTLAGIVDEDKGWGVKEDTFNCLEMLSRYGCETWFKLGDRDLATHIYRTKLLKEGARLSDVTDVIRKRLGLECKIIPMTNEFVQTKILTEQGEIHFQEYVIKRRAKDEVLGVTYERIERASPAPGILTSIEEANGIVICPSDPVVSIGPILAIGGIREALKKAEVPIVGITPIVGGRPVEGHADKFMRGLGLEVSAYEVARLYSDLLDCFVIDEIDRRLKGPIEGLGMEVVVADTIMGTLNDKRRLAKLALGIISRLRGR